MKIRRLNESADFNFNNAASSGNWPYKMSIQTYVDIRDEISQIIDNLDQSSVFAIARDANTLGLSIDEERLYYSPDATIETNISPEKINQFRSIVMKYSDEQLNEESSRKFYIDEIVSAQGGKTETERHSFATLDELKQYCKDAGLTKDDIANCGGCDVKDLCEGLEGSLHIQCCPACGCQNEYSDSQDNGSWVRYTCRSCGNTWDIDKPKNKDTVNEEVDKHTPDSRVKLEVKYEVYGRYGTGGQVKKGRVSGVDEVDALMNMLDHVRMYIDSDFADEFEKENGTRPTTEDVVERLYSENGDGCDLIYYITNLTTGNMIFDGGVVEEEEDWDNLDESTDSKLHTKPNGEYLVKSDSGKGYTAFSRDNVAIGGIDSEDADSDDKAIDKFKRNEYSERLNEEYFDTAEYRIQKYEDDIPELMAGMHDDYMEGKLDAARYAEVLKKVYDALAECDYKHTMSAPVVTNGSGKRVLDRLAELDKTNEALGIGAGLALGGAAIGAGMIGSSLLDSVEDKNKEDETELNELFDIEIDAKGFGGSGNNVHVGPGSMPLTASLEENKVISAEESVNNTKMPRFSKLKAEVEKLAEKTGLTVYVSEPKQDGDNVDLWCSELFDIEGTGLVDVIELSEDESEYLFDSDAIEKHLVSICLTDANEDDYDDDYSDDYDDSLEECSGIKAHKVIMGEDIDDSIEFDDFDDTEEPEGDKTEDIEFVMDEYVSESLLIDFIEKVDPVTYKVGVNDQVVTVVFDPKWSEYVYTIDGKGPYSHSSYEFISRDIYDFVMSQRSDDYQYDDLVD